MLIPKTLGEVGSDINSVSTALEGYRFFYLDDFEHQKVPPGKEILDLASLTWCCNLFAAPRGLSQSEIDVLLDKVRGVLVL